ncbi:MAG: DUF364 domain-containing protein [Anaerovoracaceae bacterium]
MSVSEKEFFEELQKRFEKVVEENNVKLKEIKIKSKGLTPEEAIGITSRTDYSILDGSEIMLQADCQGCIGQAFTSSPADFVGTIEDVMKLDINKDDYNKGLYISTMNSVMNYLGKTTNTIHCKDEGPDECSQEIAKVMIKEHQGKKIALIGYQPSIFQALSNDFDLRVLDLNPKNVGKVRFGVKVEHGIEDFDEVVKDWADLVLCTGSCLCNGTITNFLDLKKPVIYFGTTIAAAADLFGFKRICPKSK